MGSCFGSIFGDVIKGLLLVLGLFLISFWACALGLRTYYFKPHQIEFTILLLASAILHASHSKLKGKKFREKKIINMMNGQIFNLFCIISPTLSVFSLPQK